jgi:rhamnosyltransferase
MRRLQTRVTRNSMSEPLAGRGVCAVMVTYHPDAGLPDRLRRLVPQVGAAVIIDNGSNASAAAMLRAVTTADGIALFDNGRNLGIARALNIGVEHARSRGCSWALLMDQDSQVDDDMVEQLLAAAASFPDVTRLAIVAARYRDTSGRVVETLKLDARGELWEEVRSVITSGSLLSLDAYRVIGPFRDDFFIDYVDEEYCLRARAHAYHVIETRRPLMSHSVGSQTRHRVTGKTRWTTNHSPDRRYYIARNNTVLLREYGTSGNGSWRLKSVARCIRLCKRIAFYEQDKWQKIRAVGQGWWDGIRGRMGPRRT